jgi:tellurite resistance protein TerC
VAKIGPGRTEGAPVAPGLLQHLGAGDVGGHQVGRELDALAQYWWFYGVFTLFVLMVLALDLGVFHREAREVTTREALGWVIFWVALAMAFNFGFYQYSLWKFSADPELTAQLMSRMGLTPEQAARNVALEFLAGYLVEESLSVDNMFVFVVVFGFFGIPPKYQHRILFYGILGAIVFRTIFISLGSALMQFHWVIWVFGGFLILTGLKILIAPEKPIDPEKNPLIRLMKRVLPVTPEIEGQKFFLRRDGVLHATPLLVCLVFIEITDIIFAVDSVPAIFALTKEPLIVYTSNVFAILGLRAMFFLLAGVMHKFRYLKYGLGLVLVFVGLKMVWLNQAFGGKFPISWSLGIIATLIGGAIAASLLIPVRESEDRPGH